MTPRLGAVGHRAFGFLLATAAVALATAPAPAAAESPSADCGIEGDAPDATVAEPRAVELPLVCTGTLATKPRECAVAVPIWCPDVEDIDVYRLTLPSETDLTVVLERPSPVRSVVVLQDGFDWDSYAAHARADPVTLHTARVPAGTWEIRVTGADTPYTLRAGAGPAFDDCGTGTDVPLAGHALPAGTLACSGWLDTHGQVPCDEADGRCAGDWYDGFVLEVPRALRVTLAGTVAAGSTASICMNGPADDFPFFWGHHGSCVDPARGKSDEFQAPPGRYQIDVRNDGSDGATPWNFSVHTRDDPGGVCVLPTGPCTEATHAGGRA